MLILGIFGLGSTEIILVFLILLIFVIKRIIKHVKLTNKEVSTSSGMSSELINRYCKNCGNQINPNAIACLSCGCDPKRSNKYCHRCGVETNAEQVICVKCGVSLKNQSLSSEGGQTVASIAYLTLVGFIIALIQHSSNKTRLGAYHLRQVLGFMVTGAALSIFLFILFLPMFALDNNKIGDYAMFISIVSFVLGFVLLISIIISFINAINGKDKPAPIFGKLYEKWFANMFN